MPDIGARLTLKGEAEYKRALQEIANGQKVMRSELELVSARFEGQTKSVEGLTAKHDVLERTLNGERERVEKLREAVQRSAETYGEGDKRTQAWQIQLNRAEASAAKLEHQIDETDRELGEMNGTLEKTETDGRGLGDMVNGLTKRFGIELPDGLRQSVNGMVSLDAKSLALAGGLAGVVKALVDVEKKLVSTTKESAAMADELLTTADKTGVAADRLQEYAYAAELVDVSVETITGAQTKLLQSMDKARDGAEAQASAFAALGVEVKNADGTLRSTDDVFWDVLDALGQIDNETERDAAAMDILGKSARELNPLIKAGRDRMNELAREAHDMGYVMSTEQLKALQGVDDATQRYQKSVEALKNQIAVEFAPSAEKAIGKFTDLIQKLGGALHGSGIVQAFGYLLETVTDIISPLSGVEDEAHRLETSLRPVAKLLAQIASTFQAIKGIGQISNGLYTFDLDKISEGWGNFSTGMSWNPNQQNAYQKLLEEYDRIDSQRSNPELWYNNQMYGNSDAALYAQWDAIQGDKGSFEYWKAINGYNAGGSDNWRGGVTWVGENGPERVFLPAGSAVQTAQESRMDAGMTWYGDIVIDAHSVREIQDVVRIMQELPMRIRKKG